MIFKQSFAIENTVIVNNTATVSGGGVIRVSPVAVVLDGVHRVLQRGAGSRCDVFERRIARRHPAYDLQLQRGRKPVLPVQWRRPNIRVLRHFWQCRGRFLARRGNRQRRQYFSKSKILQSVLVAGPDVGR